MKNINITPHSILSCLIIISLLSNSMVPVFSQALPSSQKQKALQVGIERSLYQASDHPYTDFARRQQAITDKVAEISNGSLTQAQLSRLAEIRSIFTPSSAKGSTSKTDFQIFQESYAQQLNQEYNREKAALKDSKQTLQKQIESTFTKYRKEVYAPLVQQAVDEVFKGEQAQKQNATKLSKQLTSNLLALTYNPKEDFSVRFSKLTAQYKNNPQAYKGHVGDVSTVIRIAVTGRECTPDLYDIMKLLDDRAIGRMSDYAMELEG